MDGAFELAWSVLKADAYINLEQNAPNMPFVEDAMYSPNASFIPSLQRYQQTVRPDGPNYRRGASMPRNTDDGKFIGVNVAGIMGALRNAHPTATDEELQDKFAQRLATQSAHEHVHDLTESEIVDWASRAVGGYPVDERTASVPNENVDNYKTLASIGREYGAYTATEPEHREEMMGYYPFAPYLTGEKNIADLHSGSR